MEELFDLFDAYLKDKGYLAMGGQVIDATIVSALKQHNSLDENETIKEGKTPEEWEKKPAKYRPKDKYARWTSTRGGQESTNAPISVARTTSASTIGTSSYALSDAATGLTGRPLIRPTPNPSSCCFELPRQQRGPRSRWSRHSVKTSTKARPEYK
jgi:hypothetical protein